MYINDQYRKLDLYSNIDKQFELIKNSSDSLKIPARSRIHSFLHPKSCLRKGYCKPRQRQNVFLTTRDHSVTRNELVLSVAQIRFFENTK